MRPSGTRENKQTNKRSILSGRDAAKWKNYFVPLMLFLSFNTFNVSSFNVLELNTSYDPIHVYLLLFHQVTSILHMIAKKIDVSPNLKKDRCYTKIGEET
jgi:hypothetical protein